MEITIETIMYFAIGIIILTLFVLVIRNWNIAKNAKTLQDKTEGRENYEFEKVDLNKFAIKTQKLWLNCSQDNINKTLNLYVYNSSRQSNGTLNKSILFNIYKEMNWCESIQSKDNNCGIREDVEIGTFNLPKIITITCKEDKLNISC